MALDRALEDPFNFLPGAPPLYMDQLVDNDINTLLDSLLRTLARFQLRAHQTQPLKARRRLVLGAREAARKAGRLRLIVAAADLDEAAVASAPWVALKETGVPIVYGLSRALIATAVTGNPRVAIGVVGILSTDGAHDTYAALLAQRTQLRDAWEYLFVHAQPPVPAACIAAYYGHLAVSARLAPGPPGFVRTTGDGPLHIAAARGHLALLRLWAAHCDPAERNFALQTPAAAALAHGQAACAAYLTALPASRPGPP